MGTAEGFEEFVTIIDAGSVTAAAEALDLPRPTLSRRLAKLEERLGVRLIHRSTRRMKLTPQGERLYATARRVVDSAREVEGAVRRLDDVPRGRLRVSVPVGSPIDLMTEFAVDFLERHPEVSLDFAASATHVDLVAEGFDLALRGGDVEDPSLVIRHIAYNDTIAVASPEYLRRHGTPASLDDLAKHNCITGYRANGTPEPRWPLWEGGSVEVSGNLCTNQMEMRVTAALRGMGIAIVVDGLVPEELASGRLVQVLPEELGHRSRVSLVYPDREFLEPKVRAFVDAFAPWLDGLRRERGLGFDRAPNSACE